jgi:hypothetical protein
MRITPSIEKLGRLGLELNNVTEEASVYIPKNGVTVEINGWGEVVVKNSLGEVIYQNYDDPWPTP